MALTGGPTAPNFGSFNQLGTSDMVNLTTGDFSYNLNLMQVGDMPLSISYSAGASNADDGGVLGINWSPSWGGVTKTMRGLSDDMNGEVVRKKFFKKKNWTVRAEFSPDIEPFTIELSKDSESKLGKFSKWLNKNAGAVKELKDENGKKTGEEPAAGSMSATLGIAFNNYTGFELSASVSPAVNLAAGNGLGGSAGISAGMSSQTGASVTPNLNFSYQSKKTKETDVAFTSGISLGLPYNSRAGLQAFTFGADVGLVNTSGKGRVDQIRHNRGSRSIGSTAAYSFSSPSYIPTFENSMNNMNASFGLKLGVTGFGVFAEGFASGTFDMQWIPEDEYEGDGKPVPAYGLMYAHNANTDNCLMDFNREKDGSTINEDIKNIGLAQETADIFSVSAPGISGSFKISRSDLGIVRDASAKSGGGGGGLSGFDLGPGNIVDNGLNLKGNWANSESGGWNDSKNGTRVNFGYKASGPSGFKRYEPFYFRQAGEFVVESNPSILTNLGGTQASKFTLQPGSGYSSSKISSNLGNGYIGDVRRTERERRNVLFQALKASDAKYAALDKRLKFSERNSDGTLTSKNESREQSKNDDFSGKYKPDHISEIKVIGKDGKTYYFGLPSYVTKHKEVTYQTDKKLSDLSQCQSGIIPYEEEYDKPKNKTSEKYYQSSELPPYTNAFMLTAVVSADYVDKTGNGLDFTNDHGNGTKIKYFRHSKNYGWRTPYEGVNYNEGLNSKNTDDRASYVYGEKELWYVDQIESRTTIAIFHYDEREDACGALKGGGRDDNDKQLKLVKISLYAKPEYEKHGDNATPIKEAHFKYHYRGFTAGGTQRVPSNTGVSPDKSGFINEGGKLMLEQVYFTYAKSKKGKVSPYIFNYDENSSVYYGEKNADAWGVFKEDLGSSCDYAGLFPSNIENPHTNQSSVTDSYASAYSLKSIETPSGGTIEVTLKSDQYAYVQNKRAMDIITITGAGSDKNASNVVGKELYSKNLLGKVTPNDFIYFKLQDPVSSDLSDADLKKLVKKKYFQNEDGSILKYLYFKSLVEVSGRFKPLPVEFNPIYTNEFEYVQGYSGIEDFGINTSMVSGGKYTHGYIQLKNVKLSEATGGKVSPISKAGWQFTRMYLPHIAYNKAPSMGDGGGLKHIAGQLSSVLGTIQDMTMGFNNKMASKDHSRYFNPNKTFIKLQNPRRAKYGGGHRVEKLVIKDNWKTISGSNNYNDAEYGQEYNYTIVKDGETISSGVAQAEPIIIQDASPYKWPDGPIEEVKNKLAPNDQLYQEGPFGQSFMPSASVAYSKITVKNLQYKNTVTVNATGHVDHYNYTAYDFPIKFKKTGLSAHFYSPKKSGASFLKSLIGLKSNSLEATQGFYIETNNMHGVKKGEKIFNESGDQISAVTYEYKREFFKDKSGNYILDENNRRIPTSELVNQVQTLDKDGIIRTENIGVELQAVIDSKYSSTTSETSGMNISSNSFTIPPIPAWLMSLIPKYSKSESAYKTLSFTKVVNRLGVLEKVVAEDLGSVVETKNVLYDRESGQVILTETQNQYDDPVFNFTYLASWVYKQMGPSYYNSGMEIKNTTVGALNTADFVVGDELLIHSGSSRDRYWVTKAPLTGSVEIKNAAGTVFNGDIKSLKIIRSGARNQHTTPVGSITSLKSPVVNGSFALKDPGNSDFDEFYASILNASAMEFTSDWKTLCNCEYSDYKNWNVFENGRLSGWRPEKSYVYLTNRTQTLTNANTNIRKDGVFNDFTPFWVHSATSNNYWQPTSSNKWTWVETISMYSPLSQELERVNSLGIFSASVFGYNRLLPTGVAGNAMYQEIGEDNFEDIQFSDCHDDHFSFKEYKTQNSTGRSHTGRRSLFVPKNSKVTVTKKLIACPSDVPLNNDEN